MNYASLMTGNKQVKSENAGTALTVPPSELKSWWSAVYVDCRRAQHHVIQS